LPGVFFTTEKAKIEALLKQQILLARYFVGYAGWSAGQLEAEMEIDSWIVAEAAPDFIFEQQPNLWMKLMRGRALGQWVDPSRIPDDPTVN
jgi:putative transcriptional regulator